MKIGIILHPYNEDRPAGLGRAIFEWTRALIANDARNEYLIFLKSQPRHIPQFSGARHRVWVLGWGAYWLEHLRYASRADVYIFNTPIMPIFWRPPRSIVIVHDFAYRHLHAHGLKHRVVNKFLEWRHEFSLRRANHVIAVSESTKRDAVTFHGIQPEKISVVYQGFSRICQLPETPLALPEKFFLFVGVLKQRKNLKNIVQAFIRFYKHSPKYHLVIAGCGEGDYAREVVRIAKASSAAANIHFLGFISDNELAYVYRRAVAFLFPSLIEGFGFPVLEAMDCGVPVITSDAFSLPEVGGKAALIVNPHNSGEIAHAMERLVTDICFREECIKKGREHLAYFSWEKAAKRLSHVVASLYKNR